MMTSMMKGEYELDFFPFLKSNSICPGQNSTKTPTPYRVKAVCVLCYTCKPCFSLSACLTGRAGHSCANVGQPSHSSGEEWARSLPRQASDDVQRAWAVPCTGLSASSWSGQNKHNPGWRHLPVENRYSLWHWPTWLVLAGDGGTQLDSPPWSWWSH